MKNLIVEKSLPSFPNIKIPVFKRLKETENLLAFYVSEGEYPIYDDEMYTFMEEDKFTEDAYLWALKNSVKNKVVLDIGTGKNIDWATFALDYGADYAIAIEGQQDIYNKALKKLKEDPEYKQYESRLNLVKGWSTDLEFLTKADVCVSEIIGSIGGSEGAELVLKDAASRFLKEDGLMIPYGCNTKVAAVCLSDEMPTFAFHPDAFWDVDAIFKFNNAPFDLRLMLNQRRPDMLLTNSESVETLVFGKKSSFNEVELVFEKDCKVDGLFAWINLFVEKDSIPIDSLNQQTGWNVVYIPLFEIPQKVLKGDILKVIVYRTWDLEDKIHPNYSFHATLNNIKSQVYFPYKSKHVAQNSFYRKLFKIK